MNGSGMFLIIPLPFIPRPKILFGFGCAAAAYG
jgi:hypothetical protein